MEIPALKYNWKESDINLPSIKAYVFNPKDIDRFLKKGDYPLDFDTNIAGKCNADCIYCATQGGKSDVRFSSIPDLKSLNDKNISEIIKELNSIGTKTFFLCSNGEPLLNSKRFLKILDDAGDRDMNIITYTNGSTLDKPFLQELYKRKVNLVMKLESLNPELNSEIVFGKNKKGKYGGYKYGSFGDYKVSTGIIDAFEIYGSDSDCLGLETMILRDNIQEVLDIRKFAYSLGVGQFLKHLYPLGYVKLRGEEVLPKKIDEDNLRKQVTDFDSKYGFTYPSFETPDYYSYDSRRFMNNCINVNNFPLRMFAHETGGVYHSSQIVPIKFGFGTDKVISVFNKKGKIDMRNYFQKIQETLNDK